MFEPSETSRCFGLPLGSDFLESLLDGLDGRLKDKPPEARAKVTIYVNTRRTERRLHDLLLTRGPGLLPRIRIITDLASDPLLGLNLPAPVAPLRRRLELAQAIKTMMRLDPEFAPKSDMFDLADSLAALMDEMQGEGVDPSAFQTLDIASSHAAHWGRSLAFLNILSEYFSDQSSPDPEARQRLAVTLLAENWAQNPPKDPILVAGSTGSRGATALFMQAVANLPNGAVILPGFDFDMPDHVAATLLDANTSADHPQTGLAKFITKLGLTPPDIQQWAKCKLEQGPRNKLVSLALRPAPVTDQWLSEGPMLGDLSDATGRISLIKAPNQRSEALAIALVLRKAAEDGKKASLITPDRLLSRQVSAALDRWNITPDDSAGVPLHLSPPGTFLRIVASLFGEKLTSETLLILLKHPLTHSGTAARNEHLKRSRDYELEVLRGGAPFPDLSALVDWAAKRENDDGAINWATWLCELFGDLPEQFSESLSQHIAWHRQIAEKLAAGPGGSISESRLWDRAEGEEAQRVLTGIEANADAAGPVLANEYLALFRNEFGSATVRESRTVHPDITIWGTLEARVQGADLIVLGGLNDGVWPKLPAPDPWLNRSMRAKIGLLLPERRIGLSAHDFQQAIAAPQVVLSRSIRDSDAPTIASRWLIRLTNLLAGLGENGQNAVAEMEARGNHWLHLVRAIETPKDKLPTEARPSPRPPVAARPRQLSVTQIKTLIRDPYAIYARKVLGLKPLDPMRLKPDALLRGEVLHHVLEEFVKTTVGEPSNNTVKKFLTVAQEVLDNDAPWPATRRLWLARLRRIAPWFVGGEAERLKRGMPISFEISGCTDLSVPAFRLTGKADRIDRIVGGANDGQLVIYDYKTGGLPTAKQIERFDKQLPLEAAMARQGGFTELGPSEIAGLEYIGLGSGGKVQIVNASADFVDDIWDGFCALVAAYDMPETGYTARARMEKRTDFSDYDHLSRLGEWEDSDLAIGLDLS